MTNWKQTTVDKIIDKSISTAKGIIQKYYLTSGQYPIVDQGSELICGFTNDQKKVYKGDLPVVVFGDHSRALKFVDFKFALGADGTKVIKPISALDPKLFYYILINLNLPSRGYNRHFKLLKEQIFNYPENPDIQNKIIKTIDTIHNSMQIQDEIIQKYTELKNATMAKLFSEGLNKEETKITRLGNIPRNWEIVNVGDKDIAQVKYGKAKPKDNGTIPVVGSSGIYGYTKKSITNKETLVVGRKGTAGAALYYKEKIWPSDTTFYLDINLSKLRPKFLYYYMGLNKLTGVHSKTTLPSLKREDLENYYFPLPEKEEQDKIIEILEKIDFEINTKTQLRNYYQELFKSTLRKIMSQEINVGKIKL